MKKFALKPPCKRAPPADGHEIDPTSIARGEDYPDEWAKHQQKLKRSAKATVKKFNEDSAAAASAGASDSAPKKLIIKKSAVKSKSSNLKSSLQNPQADSSKVATMPSVAAHSSAAAAKSSTPVHLASGASASSSAQEQSSTSPSLIKLKRTAGRGQL